MHHSNASVPDMVVPSICHILQYILPCMLYSYAIVHQVLDKLVVSAWPDVLLHTYSIYVYMAYNAIYTYMQYVCSNTSVLDKLVVPGSQSRHILLSSYIAIYSNVLQYILPVLPYICHIMQ